MDILYRGTYCNNIIGEQREEGYLWRGCHGAMECNVKPGSIREHYSSPSTYNQDHGPTCREACQDRRRFFLVLFFFFFFFFSACPPFLSELRGGQKLSGERRPWHFFIFIIEYGEQITNRHAS